MHTHQDGPSDDLATPSDPWIDLSPPKSPVPLISHTGQDGPPDDDRFLSPPPTELDPFLDGLIKLPGGDLFDDPVLLLPPAGDLDLPIAPGPPRLDLGSGDGGEVIFTPPAGTIPGPGALPLLAAAALWQRHRRRRRDRRDRPT